MTMQYRTVSSVETMTTNSTNELISHGLDTIKNVRNTQIKVQGTYKALDGVVTMLATAESIFILVKDTYELQTDASRKQIEAAIRLIQKLDSIFTKPTGSSMKPSQHRLKDDNSYDTQLNDIYSRFDGALQQVSLQVLGITVGLSGSQEEGYRVAFNTLNETNTKVRQVFGENLAFMDFLLQRQMVQQTASDGSITLRQADIEAFNQRDSQTTSENKPSTNTFRTAVYNNTAADKLKLIAGNIGVESSYVSSFTGTSTIHDNRMGNGATIITGDVGGDAAVEMMRNIWN